MAVCLSHGTRDCLGYAVIVQRKTATAYATVFTEKQEGVIRFAEIFRDTTDKCVYGPINVFYNAATV